VYFVRCHRSSDVGWLLRLLLQQGYNANEFSPRAVINMFGRGSERNVTCSGLFDCPHAYDAGSRRVLSFQSCARRSQGIKGPGGNTKPRRMSYKLRTWWDMSAWNQLHAPCSAGKLPPQLTHPCIVAAPKWVSVVAIPPTARHGRIMNPGRFLQIRILQASA